MLLVLSLNQSSSLIFVGMDRPDLLISFFDNFCFIKSDLLHIEVMLKCEKDLHVVSLQLQKLFVLCIVDNEHLILLPFDLLLKVNIVICGFHQADSQVSRDYHVHDIDLFDDNSVNLELFLKL